MLLRLEDISNYPQLNYEYIHEKIAPPDLVSTPPGPPANRADTVTTDPPKTTVHQAYSFIDRCHSIPPLESNPTLNIQRVFSAYLGEEISHMIGDNSRYRTPWSCRRKKKR